MVDEHTVTSVFVAFRKPKPNHRLGTSNYYCKMIYSTVPMSNTMSVCMRFCQNIYYVSYYFSCYTLSASSAVVPASFNCICCWVRSSGGACPTAADQRKIMLQGPQRSCSEIHWTSMGQYCVWDPQENKFLWIYQWLRCQGYTVSLEVFRFFTTAGANAWIQSGFPGEDMRMCGWNS